METRRLGRTGHESSIAILGGAMFALTDPATTEASLQLAIDAGVNHLDIAPSYGDAELAVSPFTSLIGDWFIGGKTQRSNPDGVRAQFATTLERLNRDQIDLYQAHAITSMEDLDRRADALETIVSLRDEGATRFAGVTGHDLGAPAAHLEAVKRYDLDTVMFPIYPRLWADARYRADAEALLEYCKANDIGAQVIKAAARRPWGTTDATLTTWYEPWTTPWAIERGVRFALSQPGVTGICTPGDTALLPSVLDAATNYQPLSDEGIEDGAMAQADAELIFPLRDKAVWAQ